jgi:farnesyl diphosphate synthase
MAREPAADNDPALAGRKLRAIRAVGEAAGACGMVGGQAVDLEGAAFDGDGLRAMHARKTGALIRASAAAGAILAGANDVQLRGIEGFAADLGLAFQIVDDILDVEGASADLGKTAGKDAAAGKPTYPAIFGVDRSRQMAADCVQRALESLRAARLDGRLPEIAVWVTSRRH